MLTLAGCAQTPAPAAEPTEEAPTYVELMRDTKGFTGASDAEIEKIGESVCAALKDGSTPDDAAHMLTLGGLTPQQAVDVVFHTANELCPEVNG